MCKMKGPQKRSSCLYVIFSSFLLISLFLSSCQTKHRVYHIGILSGLDFFANTTEGFKAQMSRLGYSEGKDIIYDIQRTNFDPDKEQLILKKFVADNVDMIFTFPTEVSITAKKITQGTKIPVIFADANIEGTDLVKSIRTPGANITGVRYPGPDLAAKRFEIMLEFVPQAKHILIPYQRGYPVVASQLEVLKPIASAKGITLILVPANNPADLQAELVKQEESARGGNIDGILFVAEPLAVTPDGFKIISIFAVKYKIPVGGALMSYGDYSSLFGVATDNEAVGKQAAILADKILKGTPAGSIPVVSAESFFQIDSKAVKRSGLRINEGLLSRADKIIH